MVDGKLHHFSAGGLYNGLVLLIDDETRTYWDHITGEAVHGPQAGTQLEVFPISMTTVAAELAAHPETQLLRSKLPLKARLFSWIHRKKIGKRGFIPPPFRRTMSAPDERLPENEQGLGVVVEGEARFYPSTGLSEPIEDELGGLRLRIARGEIDRVPFAESVNDGTRPFQLFTRWYGFAYTFPGCSIHGA